MPNKWLNTILFIAAAIGALLAYRAGKEHRQVLAKHTRLEARVGRLSIRDPSKAYVLALETGEELHFAWRLYIPADFNLRRKHSDGFGSRNANRTAYECMWRLMLRENDDGVLQVFFNNGVWDLGDRRMADLLRGRWDEVRIESLGAAAAAEVDTDEVATLIRIVMSDDLKKEAQQRFGESFVKPYETVLYQVQIGSERAFKEAGLDEL